MRFEEAISDEICQCRAQRQERDSSVPLKAREILPLQDVCVSSYVFHGLSFSGTRLSPLVFLPEMSVPIIWQLHDGWSETPDRCILSCPAPQGSNGQSAEKPSLFFLLPRWWYWSQTNNNHGHLLSAGQFSDPVKNLCEYRFSGCLQNDILKTPLLQILVESVRSEMERSLWAKACHSQPSKRTAEGMGMGFGW